MKKEVFELQADEGIVLRQSDVTYNKHHYPCDLILTNKQLILVINGLFRKKVSYFQLSKIKVVNNKVQALVQNNANESSRLEVYMVSGEVAYFDFQSTTFIDWGTDEKKWANEISKLILGEEKIKEGSNESQSLTESIANTVDAIKTIFGKQKTMICPHCGASISGIVGKQVHCQFCDSKVTIE